MMSGVKRYYGETLDENDYGAFVLASDYDALAAQRDEGLAREAELREWKFCPECGSEDLHHQEGTHKQCGHCYQEYWSDLDYSQVVRGHLAKLQPLQQRLAEADRKYDEALAEMQAVIDTGVLTAADYESLEAEICARITDYWKRPTKPGPGCAGGEKA